MVISNRLMQYGVTMLSIFLLADDIALAQDSNTEDSSPKQHEAMQQAQSNDALDQQYQIDQQLLQLYRQKLRDQKGQGADAQTLHSLQQTVDAAQVKRDADFDSLSSLHQSPHFIHQEALGYHLLHAADKRKRLQRQQEQRLVQEKEEKVALRQREAQKSRQQALLVQQQQLIIAQQQNLLATEQQNQNQAYQNNDGFFYSDFVGWPMDASRWWGRRENSANSSGKKLMLNRPTAR